MVHSLEVATKGTQYMVMKHDLWKAYDRVKWSFIVESITKDFFNLLVGSVKGIPSPIFFLFWLWRVSASHSGLYCRWYLEAFLCGEGKSCDSLPLIFC